MTIDDIKNYNLSNYRPINETISNGKGKILSRTDTRELWGEQALRLLEIQSDATKEINYFVPPFKQSNMALGIYDDEKKKVLLGYIQKCLDKVTALEAMLVKCKKVSDTECCHYQFEDEYLSRVE